MKTNENLNNENNNGGNEFEPIVVEKKPGFFGKAWNWIKENPWKTTAAVTVVVGTAVIANDKSRTAVANGCKSVGRRVRGLVTKKEERQVAELQEEVATVQETAPVAENRPQQQYEGGRERNFRGDFNRRFDRNFNNNQN